MDDLILHNDELTASRDRAVQRNASARKRKQVLKQKHGSAADQVVAQKDAMTSLLGTQDQMLNLIENLSFLPPRENDGGQSPPAKATPATYAAAGQARRAMRIAALAEANGATGQRTTPAVSAVGMATPSTGGTHVGATQAAEMLHARCVDPTLRVSGAPACCGGVVHSPSSSQGASPPQPLPSNSSPAPAFASSCPQLVAAVMPPPPPPPAPAPRLESLMGSPVTPATTDATPATTNATPASDEVRQASRPPYAQCHPAHLGGCAPRQLGSSQSVEACGCAAGLGATVSAVTAAYHPSCQPPRGAPPAATGAARQATAAAPVTNAVDAARAGWRAGERTGGYASSFESRRAAASSSEVAQSPRNPRSEQAHRRLAAFEEHFGQQRGVGDSWWQSR